MRPLRLFRWPRNRWSLAIMVTTWSTSWVVYTLAVFSTSDLPPMKATAVAARSVALAWLLGWAAGRLSRGFRWPRQPSLPFLASHVLGGLVYAFLWVVLVDFVESTLGRTPYAWPPWIARFWWPRLAMGTFLYATVAGLSYAIRANRMERQARRRAERAELLVTRARLEALQRRLNPHMLFNALNTVANLIHEDVVVAEQAVERLAMLLRRVLDEDRQEIPLAEEWALVQDYLALEQLRFGDRLKVEASLDAGSLPCAVPPFLLQGLVENSLRHGLLPKVGGGTLEVRSEVKAGRLILEVADDGVGARPELLDDGEGTGLSLTRERLETAYGPEATLRVDTAPGRGFRIRLALPARLEEAAS